ncbi:hypothetical protein D805_0726 [Bifidobacterium thermophilum RBL67]|uniref:Uncharacterized protein n=1 Tax=Bifidobacterium thermophilum RBL67 TaxID=1254439 RepID=M4REL7_9BIFI|nr:hypothetical protein D805_0726 [Bifidobacterium thermophilum RBL67]
MVTVRHDSVTGCPEALAQKAMQPLTTLPVQGGTIGVVHVAWKSSLKS